MHLITRTWAGALAAFMAVPAAAAPAAPALAPPGLAERPFSAPPAAASADVLDKARGGSDAIASDTRLQGSVSGNAATNVNTGANLIQTGSFANAAGVPVVIQNTGANVLIQNATVINLQFK
jgi:hypothetical protein